MPQRRTIARKTVGVIGANGTITKERSSPPTTESRRQSQRRRPTSTPQSHHDPSSPQNPHAFDWEHMGLGLELPVSSGTTSESDAEPHPHSDPDETSLSAALVNDSDAPEATPEWVRNFIHLRRVTHHSDIKLSAAGREWLREQHRALDAGRIPLTLKCTLAASEISDRFRNCRDDFIRPAYRARYWFWSQNFLSLVDYYISHGTTKLSPRAAQRHAALASFIETSHRHRQEGTLSTHRDQLLTSLGLQWKKKRNREDDDHLEHVQDLEEVDTDESASYDSPADETWKLPTSEKSHDLRRKDNTKKRLRPRRSHDDVVMPSLQFDQVVIRPPAEQDVSSMAEWARTLVEIRKCFKKSTTYEIPENRPSLQIWWNTELARATTGTLSMVRCCLLKAAKLADSIETIEIDMNCETWCRGFVDCVDFYIEHHRHNTSFQKAPQRVLEFMFKCREAVIECTFPKEYAVLLRAVDKGWLQSRLMEITIARYKNRPRQRYPKPRISGGKLDGPVVEVVLDSGWNRDEDEPYVGKRRKKKSNGVCEKMVSSMIKGIVAENIEGRERTEAERRAEEWVSKAGTEALNYYAHNWFDAAAKQAPH